MKPFWNQTDVGKSRLGKTRCSFQAGLKCWLFPQQESREVYMVCTKFVIPSCPFLTRLNSARQRAKQDREEERGDLGFSGKSETPRISKLFQNSVNFRPFRNQTFSFFSKPFPLPLDVNTHRCQSVAFPGKCPQSKYLRLWCCQNVNLLTLTLPNQLPNLSTATRLSLSLFVAVPTLLF